MSGQRESMDNKCIDCSYFRQGSVGPTRPEHVWGDCLKVIKHASGRDDAGVMVSFRWADASCKQFEHIETAGGN
jgi:hypothetical protein